MIVRDGLATSFLITFPSGHPDGNIVWELRDETGSVFAGDSLAVPTDAVSINLVIPSEHNVLNLGQLRSFRDLSWSYTISGAVVNGEERYIIEARVPFGASAAGVRRWLGIDDIADLPDSEISLVRAYQSFRGLVGAAPLALATDSLAVSDAIEALAAISLLPSMPVRIATKESSGTNSFQRQDVDWTALGAALEAIVQDGIIAVLPNYDATAGFGALFILATPATDPITGA